MESLLQNKFLLYSLIGNAAVILGLTCGFLPELATQFEIVDFPSDVSEYKENLVQFLVRVHIYIIILNTNTNLYFIFVVPQSFNSSINSRLYSCIHS